MRDPDQVCKEMMMDFSKHRLNDWKWRDMYQLQLGDEAFDKYFSLVWNALGRLRENEYYDIAKQVKVENRDLFIKICCQYILTHKEYEFSNDYTKIIRRECFTITAKNGLQKKSNF